MSMVMSKPVGTDEMLDRIEELELKLKQAYINIRDYSSDPALVTWAKVSLKSL